MRVHIYEKMHMNCGKEWIPLVDTWLPMMYFLHVFYALKSENIPLNNKVMYENDPQKAQFEHLYTP